MGYIGSKAYNEFRLTKEYQEIRSLGFIRYTDAENYFKRELTEAEEWAVYDNKEDDNLSRMGR